MLDIYQYLTINKLIIGDINLFWSMSTEDTFYLVVQQNKRDEAEKEEMDKLNKSTGSGGANRKVYEDDDPEAVREYEEMFRN